MKRKIITCDICEKDITKADIRYKFKQYHDNYRDIECFKWTKLDMCYECYRKFVKFVSKMKEGGE